MNDYTFRYRYSFFFFLLVMIACRQEEETVPVRIPALMEIPEGFPEVDFPEGNEFTETRWALGKKLFFDPVMSSDSSISCASCHDPALAFSDREAVSLGVHQRPGTRNAPTLANVAYHPYFTREGGVPTLEMQVLVPIQEHNEFDFNILLVAERLATDSQYVRLADEAYGRTPDAFVITRSLATFERSLLSGHSPYDQYRSQGITTAMSTAALRGMELFFSNRTQCSQCHNGFNFTNYAFENNGLYQEYPDEGRFRLTHDSTDLARFKVPSLRNIALTGPYMHDGSISTLEAVIEHYQTGGKAHPHKSDRIQPLTLTPSEKQDLVEFLKSLTDETFVSNSIFSE